MAGSDLQRTQAFYATVSAIEKMTGDFSDLFRTKLKPTDADLEKIKNSPPEELNTEGFNFQQSLEEDAKKLAEMRSIQGLSNSTYPRVNIAEGPFSGLYASIIPYKMSSTATNKYTEAQVILEREFNNYLVADFSVRRVQQRGYRNPPGSADDLQRQNAQQRQYLRFAKHYFSEQTDDGWRTRP